MATTPLSDEGVLARGSGCPPELAALGCRSPEIWLLLLMLMLLLLLIPPPSFLLRLLLCLQGHTTMKNKPHSPLSPHPRATPWRLPPV
jgi:hypothetical protein